MAWILLPLAVMSQARPGSFPVGQRDITLVDSSLQAPTVAAHVWYPATGAGTSTPVAAGAFPVIALGHGFNLDFMDYGQICSHLASWGHVVVSPDVQNGFNVDHLEFARQLAACLGHLQAQGDDSLSPFFQHVDSMTGVCGHSMGGGASALVPGVYPAIDAVSGFAAAETTPSAIAALGSYGGPFQAISGSEDNVAPENSNQQPMYNAVTGSDRQWLSILGGAHCKFTDGSTVCDFVSAAGSVTRPAQIRLAKRYVTAFFNYHLKGDADGLSFLCGDSLQADIQAGLVGSQQGYVCSVAAHPGEGTADRCGGSPNPFADRLRLHATGTFSLHNIMGQVVWEGKVAAPMTEVDVSALPRGMYLLQVDGHGCGQVLVKE